MDDEIVITENDLAVVVELASTFVLGMGKRSLEIARISQAMMQGHVNGDRDVRVVLKKSSIESKTQMLKAMAK